MLMTILLGISRVQCAAHEFVAFLRDMSWDNFVIYYGSLLWPLAEPYMAMGAVPEVYGEYLKFQSDLDWIGVTYDDLYDYSMYLIKLGFFNMIDPFQDNGYPLIPEIPEFERPTI